MSETPQVDRARRDAPRTVRRDLPLLWLDARFASATLKRRPDARVAAAPADAVSVMDRVESELFGEATRYRYALWACIAVALMPAVLAGVLWSGLYWLPVRILWFPFERGAYGLPWLSLYEWLAYLLLAAFFALGFSLIAESRACTHRLSADYHRLAETDERGREAFAAEVVSARRERTRYVLRTSPVFAPYAALLDSLERSASQEAS